MRLALALVLLLAACDKMPARPDEAKFRAASSEEKCKLTAPRAMHCSDELLLADLDGMDDGNGELSKAVGEELKKDPKPTTDKQRRAMHETRCAGALDDGYVNAVFDCWSVADCKSFAACVAKKQAAAPKRKPTPETD